MAVDTASRAIERRPSLAARIAIAYIETYRARVAPRFQARCRFEPTCSAYGLEAYHRYGFLLATAKTLWRLARCDPFRRRTGIVDPP
jgi:putative membrane protein insertion efficiency factor